MSYMYRSKPETLRFQSIPPFIFPLQSPLSVFNGVTKHMILPNTYEITFFCEMGLFTLHSCCVSWLFNFLKLKLDSQSHLTFPESSGYHYTTVLLKAYSDHV